MLNLSSPSINKVDEALIPNLPFNIVIEKILNYEQIVTIFSQICAIPASDIRVTNEDFDIIITSDNLQLECQVCQTAGEFNTMIVLWSDSKIVQKNVLAIGSIVDVGRKVSQACFCKCLVSSTLDEDNADDAYYLVDQNTVPKVVLLDPYAIEDDIYKILKEDPKRSRL